MTVRILQGDCIDRMRELPEASVDAVVCDPPYGLEFMGKDWDRPWAVSPTSSVGYEGREDNLTLPSHRDGRNANCRRCGGRARGAKRCQCASPQWDRAPAQDMRDFQAWCEQWAREALRVLKPGGHLLAFGGTRTYHRLAAGIEDAGFEIRDSILSVGGGDAPSDPSSGLLAWMYGSGRPRLSEVAEPRQLPGLLQVHIGTIRAWHSVPRRARSAAGSGFRGRGTRRPGTRHAAGRVPDGR